MKLTKTQLRQIIKEEIVREAKSTPIPDKKFDKHIDTINKNISALDKSAKAFDKYLVDQYLGFGDFNNDPDKDDDINDLTAYISNLTNTLDNLIHTAGRIDWR